MDYIQKNKDAYNKISKPFASTRLILWDDLIPLKQYTKEGDRVLDVGCGTGRLYQLFDGLSIRYTGIDQSEGQLKFAKKDYSKGEFLPAEMTSVPFGDSEFDVVYCIATLHHLPDEEMRKASLEEMKRVLKPGGRVILTNWNLDSDWVAGKMRDGDWKRDGDHFDIPFQTGDKKIHGWRHYWRLTFEYLEKLFREVGLETEHQYYSTRGKETDIKIGDNIVSILRLKN
ncbi:MAG: class I SAM-dependent methyltransferase [Candidatus Magasanikbacteria bacterium]